jgi:hypothetical protein
MDTKLTLKLNKDVIDQAKEYATSNKRSLSRIVEAYLKSLANQTNTSSTEEIQISPFVKSISTGAQLPVNEDLQKEYMNHLSSKYK